MSDKFILRTLYLIALTLNSGLILAQKRTAVPPPPPAPVVRTLVVNKTIVMKDGTGCVLNSGDLIARKDYYDGRIETVLVSSKDGNCQFGWTVAISPDDLREMVEYSQFTFANGGQEAPSSVRDFKAAQEKKPDVSKALDPAHRIFVVYDSLAVSSKKGQCVLNAGDVLTRLNEIPDASHRVLVSVSSSARNDCRTGETVMISVDDLEAMAYHFERQLDAGLKALASKADDRSSANGSSPAGLNNPDFTIDGVEVSADELTQTGNDFQLRDGSGLTTTLSDGLHELRKKTASAQSVLSFHEFVWKQKLGLMKFEPFKKSYAVVIAVEDYGDKSGFPKLPGADKQCGLVATALQEQGFLVKQFCGKDATRDKIESYLEGNLIKVLGEDDRVLFYFGGHGYSVEDRFNEPLGYLVTYGATQASVVENSIPMSRIQSEYVRMMPAKHVLFVLDACFSGLANTESTPSPEPAYRSYLEIKDLSERPSRAILTAGSGDDPGLNNNNGGIFTRAFLEGIRGAADQNKDGVITEHELLEYVRLRVINEANTYGYKQVPQYNSLTMFGAGEFIFLQPVGGH